MNVPVDEVALKLRMGEEEEPEDSGDETNAADLAHSDEERDDEEEEADLGTPEKKKKTKARPAHQPNFDGKVGIWPSKVEFKTAK